MAFTGLALGKKRADAKKVKTKICSNPNCDKAGIEQPIEEFYKRTETPDGHTPECRTCAKKYQRELMKEKIRAQKQYFPF